MQCDGHNWGTKGMRGPLNETLKNDMESSQAEKGLGKPSMRRKVHTSTESGTCNVCFAPCSSCMHLKVACMGSKGDAFSDETCHSLFKSRACDSLQHTTSEASNLLSVSSSHDSLSENAESKVNRKSSDADASAESHMHPKMTSGRAVAEDQFSLKAESFPDQKTFSKTHVDSKSEEGHDDNISCVSRANYASEVVSYHNKNLDMNNCLHSSALEAEGSGKALLSHKSGSFETPSNDFDAGSSSPKVQTKCLSSNANAATIDCVGNLAAHNIADNQANGKSTLDADSSKVSCKINSNLELDADKDSGTKQMRVEKLNEPDELADIPMLQSASGDESGESEILEHDVKVCDICGDAGREDSLAICSRCADGAEHIYCMREMLQNLPEDAEKRMNVASTQNSGKRHAEPVELASAPKKRATETSLASPKSCSPSRIAAVSRDTSSKSLDKGKVKIGHQTSFGNKSCIDIPEIARPSVNGPRVQTLKGALLKSNSSNTLNSKLKAKLVDEVPQKRKGTRESSFDMEEPGRMMRKSMSFKSVSSGRSSTNELKVKMLSSKFSQIQDSRGLKQVKDRDAVDRKNCLDWIAL
uniref:Zinc finger PHD-type domain-containing protein n=1 Tax=Salix viminalis TaxID=40686 RepID=A0A6N2NKL8_SALVM